MNYPAYGKYKDSGVPWLGKVPTHWGMQRLKFTVALNNEKIESVNTDTSYIGLENIEPWTGKLIAYEGTKCEGKVSIYRKNDILFGKLRPYLAKVYWTTEEEGVCSTEIFVLRAKNKTIPNYVHFLILCRDFINVVDSLTYGTKMPRANWESVGNILTGIPPLPEQETIAAFLDKKTTEIDTLIGKKEELLKLLSEKRTALITHAVTKGLNKTAMKDSGVPWLGQIPVRWDIQRLKFTVVLNNEKIESVNTDTSYIGLENIEPWTGKLIKDEGTKCEGKVNIYQKNDILFGKLRPYLAKVYLAKEEEGVCSTEVFVLRAKNKVIPNYVHFLILCRDFINVVDSLTYGTKMPRANWESVGSILTTIPPLPEQQKIAAFLDKKTAEIDKTAAKIKEAVALFKEYRSALITAAVTGQINVQSFPSPSIPQKQASRIQKE